MAAATPPPPPDSIDMRTALRDTAEQRDAFRQTADTLSQEVVKLKEQVDAYASRLQESERTSHAVRNQYAARLEEAQRDASADMLTRDDLEAMRLQLVDQTEGPWRQRVKVLETELGQTREAAGAHRREAERARAALDATAHEQRAVLREAEVRHETVAAELRAKIELLESAPGGGGGGGGESVERARRLQREHAEASVRCQKLVEEVDELRRENDGLLQVRAELLATSAAAAGEAQATAKLHAAEKASLERRASHLQHELDLKEGAVERMHEAALHTETEVRSLRVAVDQAKHDAESAKAAGNLRYAEAQRELNSLKLEMERRQTEGVRREALLQKSRDELASTAAQAEREASAQLANARDEEAARVRRLEAERTRLNEQLAQQQSTHAAQAAQQRDRADALSGEVAALKAELHGASLESRAASEESVRLRRRTEEAEERLEATLRELHDARLQSSEAVAGRQRLTEVEGQSAVAQEKLQLQLAAVQKESDRSLAQAQGHVQALTAKVKHVKKLAMKEREAYQQAEAVRVRQLEALKREVHRLRGERELLKREALSASAASLPAAFPAPPGGAPPAGAAREDVRSLMAASVAAQSAIGQEAAALKATVAGVTAK